MPRAFRIARGAIIQDSAYGAVRVKAAREHSPRRSAGRRWVRRPYDPRHAAVSLWLNSGVRATEVARRARHGVAVLLKIYAHCIDGQAGAANQRISHAVSTLEAEQDLSDEVDADSESGG